MNIVKQKTLRSCTIIPPDLYVERSADIQLQRTILDMGRPGYILVSRQMGKTNLLLHSKRRLSNESDKFLYIDISNLFSDVRGFFQNIIDTFLESFPEISCNLSEHILERRKVSASLPPHKEHENELRQIIQALHGKLVICLDEIDALTKTNYADQVFSFIRSTYFSARVNFPEEFGRLTYVLSGVAEPSELIKDKAVSPFNIGEKIYLDDFTREEFNDFTRKAGLQIEQAVKDRIYYWASGNPRISWDICSAVEDHYLAGNEVTDLIVDSIVTEMYLSNFDLPPIDHIRTLVEDDKQIRNAIMSIHYNKSEDISDSIRNKLYLSGITKPDQGSTRKVIIRNRLLTESLSENWLKDIERRKTPIIDLANKLYIEKKYEDALALYLEYADATNSPEDPSLLFYHIGACKFELGHYNDVILFYQNHPVKKEDYPELYYWMRNFIGFSYLYLNEPLKSAENFRKILDQPTSSTPLYIYFDSCINLSRVLFEDFNSNSEEIRELNQKVLDSKERIRELYEENNANRLLVIASYNLARAFKIQGDNEAANSILERVIEIVNSDFQASLCLEICDSFSDQDERINLLKRSVAIILDNEIPVDIPNKAHSFNFSSDVCLKLLVRLSENLLDNQLDDIVNHLTNNNIPHKVLTGDILYGAANKLFYLRRNTVALKLATSALDLPYSEDVVKIKRQVITFAILVATTKDIEKFILQYREDFLENPDSTLIGTDFRVAWQVVHNYIENNIFDKAQETIELLRILVDRYDSQAENELTYKQVLTGKAILDSLDLELGCHNRPIAEYLDKSKDLIDQLGGYNTFDLPLFPNDFHTKLRRRVHQIANNFQKTKTIRREGRKYGRNDKIKVRFEDGRIAEGKYKNFSTQLDSGLCLIISDL